MANGPFEQYPSAAWDVAGSKLAFPVESINITGGNRIIEQVRPYRDGAKLDDTGSEAVSFTFSAVFNNSLQIYSNAEPGLTQTNEGLELYPDVLNLLIYLFDEHETGDLTVPNVGNIRARAVSYSRDATGMERDTERVQFVFKQDNEDNVDAASFTAPSVEANGETLALAAEFDEQSESMWDGSLADLNELAANLEGIANAPGDMWQDMESQANIVMGAHDRVVNAWSNPDDPGRDLLLDPESSGVQRKLNRQKELAGKIRQSGRRGLPAIVTKVYPVSVNIFTVSADVGQSVVTLIEINSQLADLMEIAPGVPVRILSDAAA